MTDQIHMPIGFMPGDRLWFEYDNFRRHERYINLCDSERAIVEQFRNEGCYLYKNAFGNALLQHLNAALDTWEERNRNGLDANRKPDGTYPRLIGLHEEVPQLQQLFSNVAVLQLQHLLFGSRRSVHTSITFLQSSQQTLHRDIPVFHPSPGSLYFRIWCALEGADALNGTLRGVKGSHRICRARHDMQQTFYERFEAIPSQDPQQWRSRQEKLKTTYEEHGLVEERFDLNPGDAFIWHPLFAHSGGIIEDKARSRRSVVLHVSMLPLP